MKNAESQHISSIDSSIYESACFASALNGWLKAYGMEGYLFNVCRTVICHLYPQTSWYNDIRKSVSPTRPQLIDDATGNHPCIVILSHGKFFDYALSRRRSDGTIHTNFIDSATDNVISNLMAAIHPSLGLECYNLDRPPYLHAQSMGHVSGATEYVSDYSRDTQRNECIAGCTNTLSRIPTSIHPRYGGWFAYRILIVLTGVTMDPNYPSPSPLKFLSDQDRRSIFEEYNHHPELGYWRDYHDKSTGSIQKYDPVQFAYFHETCLHKRRRLIELMLESRTSTA